MLTRLQQYLTPVVATIALAVLGATALAVTPEIIDRVGDDSTEQGTDNQDLQDTATDSTDPADVIGDLETEELAIDALEEEEGGEDVSTPTVTPTDSPSQEPNHGHYVSCVAHMAKADSLQGRQKGAIVSYAAKQDVVLPKGDEAACAAAYAAAKSAATATEGQKSQDDTTESSTAGAEKKETAPVSGVAQEAQKQSRGPGQPSGQAARSGGGRGPK